MITKTIGWVATALIGLLLPVQAGAEVVDEETFDLCAVYDSVDEFTDERSSILLCFDEANQAFAGFQCSSTVRGASLSLGFDLDWLVRVGYRVGSGEVRWGTWHAEGRLAIQQSDSEDSSIEAREDAARVIDELEDAVAFGHSIVFEIDGERSKIEFPDQGRDTDAMTEYRDRCAAIISIGR